MSTRRERILEQLVVKPGTAANLAERDPGWTGGPDYEGLSQEQLKAEAKAILASGVEDLSDAQELLWASDTYALLVVFQAMDAAGKDSAIEHVMSGVNPQGVQVVSFEEALGRRARPRLSLADARKPYRNGDASASSTARTTRRSSRCACTPSGSTSSSCRAAVRGPGVLGRAPRGHQCLRAPPRPERDEDREVLPLCLEGGAEEAFLRSARRADKEWKFNAADVTERARWDDYMAAFDGAITPPRRPGRPGMSSLPTTSGSPRPSWPGFSWTPSSRSISSGPRCPRPSTRRTSRHGDCSRRKLETRAATQSKGESAANTRGLGALLRPGEPAAGRRHRLGRRAEPLVELRRELLST